MAPSLLPSLLLILTFLPPLLAATNLRTVATLFRSHPISEPAGAVPPTTYFEVTKPIQLPKTQPCSYLVLQHDFASTYGKPPVLASYQPPSDCPSQNFAKIVLEWTATSKGRQYDRIFGVWIGGVEILRSCTAEPRATGIVWTVKKDITSDITFGKLDNEADLILPISRNLPLNDGLWFEIENSTDIQGKEIKIPQNAYRAVLEVYVSFHENDEFWFGNYPNEYISVNNLTGFPGNGPFREVVVSLDDVVIGAIWPFTVIYTGGVNPLLWRPISGIGSFDLPTYDIEVTPFLGRILDQKGHKFAFRVTNALNVWYIDANLHLWLDKKWERTQGKVLKHRTSPLALSLLSNFSGFDGSFVVKASRSIVSSGWVRSSHGVIITKSQQKLKYGNAMILGNDSNLQKLDQIIKLKESVHFKIP
ncbi:Peptide-N(4)-(N-acetyl-beta-glucosaminyl)asparagine amidase [Handroanthus impetiginosus]|uniref:Peptide-N(4)-(N-acetyl-beta-glucosaminyl)asparagine amidase n=1 Tax=Handroanthus impetiginosus TaxID=429701 RepID=A0A2G9HF93_9LAMI|nr:Peptide-N(4)-(N-acetyl-beta-glucosaminyl)asparagine amidase [Handroanthus impetiginosus]